MKLDKNRAFGTIKSIDPKQKVFFNQDGIDYDRDGNPTDKKQVTAYNQSVLENAQQVAADAQEVADGAVADAEAAQALLEGDDAPKTVAALKDALDELNVEYTARDTKADLEQLWVDAQAA